jgi:NAD(P)-dependent dehydrogenase (short-subunit alcohol dehydrogenase family)
MSSHVLEGRRALVTGGSRGIGFMIAQGLAAAGADVFITSRKPDACARAAEEIAKVGSCTPLPADLSEPEAVTRLAEELGEHVSALDVLVNNAGAAWGAPLADYPPEAFDKVWTVNVKAVFALTQRLLPLLRAAATPGSPARVINIGSVDGIRITDFDNYAYTSSKAAVHQLTRHLASKLAREHIAVNAIAPGPFPSKMMAHIFDDETARAELEELVPLGRAGEPADIAALSVFMAGPGARWMTGAIVPLDGGLSLR